jgi:hypothetical protein|tara:strand:+ start:10007 stop:10858 length:852 start_codon:yes stop_codon:yes gene_type:complete
MPGILNSINNAVQSIGNKANSLVGGSLAQPGLSLFGTNLPFTPLISFRDRFLDSLDQWNTSIPLNTQFIVLIDNFPLGLTTNVLQNLEPIVQRTGFDINLPKATLTNYKNQAIVGCIFTNGFNIGDDSLDSAAAKIENNRGFIQGTILKDRSDFASNKFTLSLRETNSSFVDFVIRPWVIMASHFGMVARDKNNPAELIKDPKVNLTVVQYTRSDKGLSQIPRKTWRFYNCVPTSVSTRDYQYGDTEDVKNFDTQWVYDRYEISSNLYLNIGELIKAINPFPF